MSEQERDHHVTWTSDVRSMEMTSADWNENDRPVLAMACFDRPPLAAASGGWQTFDVTCDGFYIGHQNGWGKFLYGMSKPFWEPSSLIQMEKFMAAVWSENFAGINGLGYGASLSHQTAYAALLHRHGLTWSPPGGMLADRWTAEGIHVVPSPGPLPQSMAGHLRQAIYPMDATDTNLSILTDGAHTSVTDMLGEEPTACGAWLVILGQNCD